MPIRLVEATPDRVLYVAERMRAADREEVLATAPHDDARLFAAEVGRSYGPFKWCIERDGIPVAILGASELWPGVWAAWLFATDSFRNIRFYTTRFVVRGMIPALHRLGAHRCEARSSAAHTEAHRWLRAMGAVEEARLRRYGKAGEDFIIFRWDRDDVHEAEGAGLFGPTRGAETPVRS